MIKAAIETILGLKEAKDQDAEIVLYGNYSEKTKQAKFNNLNGVFDTHTYNRISRQVSTIESLIKAVIEESRRLDNKTGDKMTVSFNESGGYFYINDDFYAGEYTFERKLSSQWEILNQYINKNLDHETLLFAIQALKPSLGNQFQDLYGAFLEIKFIGEMIVNSRPILTPGREAGEEYKINYSLDNEKREGGELYIPPVFSLKMPYTKASNYELEFNIDILISLDENKKPKFKLLFPEKEAKIEEAIFHEVECFNIAVKETGLTDLLILEDY